MSKGQSGAQLRRETVVADTGIYAALAAMAAVIEEPHCAVGHDELKQLVHAHGRLSDAIGIRQPEYQFRDGVALHRRTGAVCKRPVAVADAP